MPIQEPYSSDDIKRRKRKNNDLVDMLEYSELDALCLITREGLRLAFSAIPGYAIDPDLLSSLGAVVVQSGDDATNSLGYKNTLEVILCGNNSSIFLIATGRFFLICASRQISKLEKNIQVVRHYAGEIAKKYPQM